MTARESQTALEHSTQIPFASHFYNAIGARTRVSGSFSSHRCFRQREWPLIGCDKDGALVAPEVPRPATEHAPAHTRPSSTPDSSAVPFLIWRRKKTRVCEWLVCQPDLTLTYSSMRYATLPPFANPARRSWNCAFGIAHHPTPPPPTPID